MIAAAILNSGMAFTATSAAVARRPGAASASPAAARAAQSALPDEAGSGDPVAALQSAFQEISSPTYAELGPDELNQELTLFGNVGDGAAANLTALQGVALSSATSGPLAATAAFADMWVGAYPQVAQEASFSGLLDPIINSDTFQKIGSYIKEKIQDQIVDYVVKQLEPFIPYLGEAKTAYDAASTASGFIDGAITAYDKLKVLLAGKPAIGVDPTSLSFVVPNNPAASSDPQTFTVTNTGTGDMTISVTTNNTAEIAVSPDQATLAEKDSQTFTVTATYSNPFSANATITVSGSNTVAGAPQPSSVTVPVTLSQQTGTLNVSPPTAIIVIQSDGVQAPASFFCR